MKKIDLYAINTMVKRYTEIVTSIRPYVFQQDSTLAHKSHLLQNLLFVNVNMFCQKRSGTAMV